MIGILSSDDRHVMTTAIVTTSTITSYWSMLPHERSSIRKPTLASDTIQPRYCVPGQDIY